MINECSYEINFSILGKALLNVKSGSSGLMTDISTQRQLNQGVQMTNGVVTYMFSRTHIQSLFLQQISKNDMEFHQ
jgi:hypothetical protein